MLLVLGYIERYRIGKRHPAPRTPFLRPVGELGTSAKLERLALAGHKVIPLLGVVAEKSGERGQVPPTPLPDGSGVGW
ncbi:hypothetical protein D9M68_642050 [compost metagenome]